MARLLIAIWRAIEKSDETRYQISQGSGVSQSQLSRFMRDEAGLSVANVEKLADYLGLEITIRPKRKRRKRK